MARMDFKPPKEPSLYRLDVFGGLNTSANPTQIRDNQSPDMLNFQIGAQGDLVKRTGYERVFASSLGEGPILGMTTYRNHNGGIEFIVAHGTRLYSISNDGVVSVQYEGMSGNPVHFFVVGTDLFIMDGVKIMFYSGAIHADLSANAYIPTITISNLPVGGGEPYEDFNLIGNGFSELYSGDGISTEYQLSLKGLDNILVEAVIDGSSSSIMEGNGLTVNRETGKVTFTTAPTKGTNNVKITAFKSFPEFVSRIYNCTQSVLYGGANDTRVFLTGNPDFPNYIWRSGLYEPTYFPENGFYKVGDDNEKVMGFSKQYDTLIIEKEFSKWNMQFELNEGVPSFPIKPLNNNVGTIAKQSVQLVDNSPISLSKNGVYILVSSNVRDERNVQHVSEVVDRRLLNESNLDKAISIDYNKKYWLALNGRVYIYDYQINEWFMYDNIHPSCFLEKDGYLYFGSNTDGLVYRFKKSTESDAYNDDGQAINAYWYSKLINFGAFERNKLVKRIFYSLLPGARTSCNLYIRTDKKGERLIDTHRMDSFGFWLFDFSKFSFETSDIPQSIAKKIKEKKITHFQLKVENKELDESLGINSIGLKHAYQNEVK
ncbi:hypothetical protein AB3Z07_05095 [Metabacillus halosaccharovorans]|uniref:hypothetical protein n=1 Tax=Metabacillus halosaccharovorans TaxID=930124 RepID=UPI0034CD3FC7